MSDVAECGIVPLPRTVLRDLASTGAHLIWVDTMRGVTERGSAAVRAPERVDSMSVPSGSGGTIS